MKIIIFFIGVFMFALGFGYLYHPDKVQKFNSWIRDNVFNDRLLITHRRKLGTMLIFIGTVIIYLVIKCWYPLFGMVIVSLSFSRSILGFFVTTPMGVSEVDWFWSAFCIFGRF